MQFSAPLSTAEELAPQSFPFSAVVKNPAALRRALDDEGYALVLDVGRRSLTVMHSRHSSSA
jgi:hypothetical protein